MSQKIIPASELIHESWQNYRQHWLTYVEFGVWYVVLSVATWGVDMAVRTWSGTRLQMTGYTLIAYLPILLLSLYMTMVFIQIIWSHVSDTEVKIIDFLNNSKSRYLSLIIASIIAAVIILGGTLLLIVPGIILYVRYRFFPYFVVIEGKPAKESLKLSTGLSNGKFWPVFWRLIAVMAFFISLSSLMTSVLFALLGTAAGDTGKYFGTVSQVFTLGGGDLLATSVLPQISLALVLPLIIGAELILWNNLKNTSK